MKITTKFVKLRDIYQDYKNDKETNKVSGYSGNLNIRPEYQR